MMTYQSCGHAILSALVLQVSNPLRLEVSFCEQPKELAGYPTICEKQLCRSKTRFTLDRDLARKMRQLGTS
jgi:hypothetical protein